MRRFQTITLKRGMCFGPCPVYTVTVSSDGRVEWDGDNFVTEWGERTWEISGEGVRDLDEALRAAGFTDLSDAYDEVYVTCVQTDHLTVVFEDGSEKQVEHYVGDESAPDSLDWLKDRIDEIVGTKPYIGTEWDMEDE